MKNAIDDNLWKYLQERLGYNDDELEKFKNNPRNVKVLQKAGDLLNKTVIFEVTYSHGCNIEHKTGDKFYFAAEGYMLAHKGPKKVCPYIMTTMAKMMTIIQERIYESLNPHPLFFNRGQCEDIGLECGGWGKIIIEARVEERKNSTSE